MHSELENSRLARLLVDDPYSDVWDFWGVGEYPVHAEVKAEVERGVAEQAAGLSADDVAATLAAEPRLVQHARLTRGVDLDRDAERLVAFYRFARDVRVSQRALYFATLDYPRANDRVFSTDPDGDLYGRVTRDGLLPLTPDLLVDDNGGAFAHFRFGDQAIFPHPWVSAARELVWELVDLARASELRVSVAIDPHRLIPLSGVPVWVLEDYWTGVVVDEESLDSLDVKHLGTSFHAAASRSEADELFFPLLGTRFEWRRRDDDAEDIVKTMQIEEIVPPDSRICSDNEYVWNRLAHAERDTRLRRFTHLDGKVQLYDKSTYGPNRLAPTVAPGGASRARKLWRVDGEIDDEVFGRLLGLFYRGNELIEEHFREALAWPAEAASASNETSRAN